MKKNEAEDEEMETVEMRWAQKTHSHPLTNST